MASIKTLLNVQPGREILLWRLICALVKDAAIRVHLPKNNMYTARNGFRVDRLELTKTIVKLDGVALHAQGAKKLIGVTTMAIQRWDK